MKGKISLNQMKNSTIHAVTLKMKGKKNILAIEISLFFQIHNKGI